MGKGVGVIGIGYGGEATLKKTFVSGPAGGRNFGEKKSFSTLLSIFFVQK